MTAPGPLIAGRYRLVNRVATGGMGSVWQAWDELLQRPVAVKQVLAQPGLSMQDADTARNRVIREARITARLHHPHAVTLFDVVEQDGHPCLIMQYVPSRSLHALLLERGALQPAFAARIGAEVASALAAAHQVGIVHRDVKPGNVLITDDGSAKLTDFGISHAVGDVSLTSTGMLTGTPAFLAPEVARGAKSGFPADVFSLGATLFAALEGTPPFGTDQNPMAILHRVASGQVIPPRRSGPLTPLLLEMLALEPADRPAMVDVADTLAGIYADTSGSAPPDSAQRGMIPVPPPAVPPVKPAERTAAQPDQWTGLFDPPAIPEAPPGSPGRRRPAGVLVAVLVAAVLAGAIVVGSLLLRHGNSTQGATAPTDTARPSTGSAAVPGTTAPTPPTKASTRQTVSPSSSLPASSSVPSPTPSPTSRTKQTTRAAILPGTVGSTSSPAPSTGPASRPPSSTTTSSSPSSPSTSSVSRDAAPNSAELAESITDYYALLPVNTDDGWVRLTPRFQTGIARNRQYYQSFWDGVQRVLVSDASGVAPETAEATITYYFKDGRVSVERTAYRLVRDGGLVKIDSSTVLNSQAG